MYSSHLKKYSPCAAILLAVILMLPASNRTSALMSVAYQEDRDPVYWFTQKFFRHVAWQPDANLIAAGESRDLWLYSTEMVETGHVAIDEGFYLKSIAWSPNGDSVALLSGDSDYGRSWRLQVLDVLTLQPVLFISESDIPIYDLTVKWRPDGTQLAMTVDHEAQIRNAVTGEIVFRLFALKHPMTAAAWSPDGNQLATVSGGLLQTWDTNSGNQINSISNDDFFDLLTWSRDGSQLATTSGRSLDIEIRDASTLEITTLLQGHTGTIQDIAWSSGGLASTALVIHVWDVSGEQIISTIQPRGPVFSLDWSPDGTQLVYGGASGILEIVDIVHLKTELNALSSRILYFF